MPLPDDDVDFYFMAAMSAFRSFNSMVTDFSIWTTSARDGWLMVAGWGADLGKGGGDGGGRGFWAAVEDWVERVGEDRRDRDTRLSRAL